MSHTSSKPPPTLKFVYVRTVSDWEQYAGVRFRDRSVKQDTIDGNLPPNDPEQVYSRVFKHCIDIHSVLLNSVDFVAVILNKRSASVGLRPISLETSRPV